MTQYVNHSQLRYERMKMKIAEASALAKKIEEAVALERSAKLKKEELERLENQRKAKELEARKAEESNVYERPQAKAAADAYLESTKEFFAMSSAFDNSQDSLAKNLKMKMKLTINRRTGQITDSLKQIKAVVSELVQLCYEGRTTSKQAFSYCLILLASKLLVNVYCIYFSIIYFSRLKQNHKFRFTLHQPFPWQWSQLKSQLMLLNFLRF